MAVRPVGAAGYAVRGVGRGKCEGCAGCARASTDRYPIRPLRPLCCDMDPNRADDRNQADPQPSFWAGLFASHQARLNGFFRRRLARPVESQDLVQEVYLRLLRIERGEAARIVNPEAYLFTVAANLIKEQAVLHRRNLQHVDVTRLYPDLEAGDDAVEDVLDRERLERRLAEAIERLPPRHRAVMLMQHRDGLSYAEMAQCMGVSTHMIKKYVVKALALCRNDLAGYR